MKLFGVGSFAEACRVVGVCVSLVGSFGTV